MGSLRTYLPGMGVTTVHIEQELHFIVVEISVWLSNLSKITQLVNVEPLDSVFLNFNVHLNHLGTLLKCRFWHRRWRAGPGILHFQQAATNASAAGPTGHGWSSTALELRPLQLYLQSQTAIPAVSSKQIHLFVRRKRVWRWSLDTVQL